VDNIVSLGWVVTKPTPMVLGGGLVTRKGQPFNLFLLLLFFPLAFRGWSNYFFFFKIFFSFFFLKNKIKLRFFIYFLFYFFILFLILRGIESISITCDMWAT
jgi:hypothetical protein